MYGLDRDMQYKFTKTVAFSMVKQVRFRELHRRIFLNVIPNACEEKNKGVFQY